MGSAVEIASRKALRPGEAAKALGVSLDYFQEHIQPELKVVRKGRVRLIPVSELDRWLDENATPALRCDVRLLRTVGIPWANFFQRFPAVPSGC